MPSIVLVSCNNDDTIVEDPMAMDDDILDSDSDPDNDDDDTVEDLEATVEVFNPDLVYDGYILVNDAGNNRAYLMDKEANLLHETAHKQYRKWCPASSRWPLAILEADTPLIEFGGKGGKIQFVQKDGTVDGTLNIPQRIISPITMLNYFPMEM